MMTREQLRRVKRRKLNTILICIIVIQLIAIVSILAFRKFQNEHFRKGTLINGINCSLLSIEEAETKINNSISLQNISFIFLEKNHNFLANSINLKLASTTELESILNNQRNGDKSLEYSLEDCFVFDEKLLRENVLRNIDCLKQENMKQPQNAYLTVTQDGFLEIVPEESGFIVNFEEAYLLASESLKTGKTSIDFSEIIISESKITSTDKSLNYQRDSVNSILSTVVTFSLFDDTIVTLDHSITQNWLVQDENGVYNIDIDSNLPAFVSTLSEKVKQSDSYLVFSATDVGKVKVPCQIRLDTHKQLETLKEKLINGGSYYCLPEYSNDFNFESYVELDLSRQTVWMYHNGECILETPCVTSDVSDGYSTPPGLFYLTYKTTNTYLRGYNKDGSRYKCYVSYWMPFNGGIGLHDATWRNKFGGTIYKTNGSHGCVNLPLDAAKTIYKHITSTTPIVVYSSEA